MSRGTAGPLTMIAPIPDAPSSAAADELLAAVRAALAGSYDVERLLGAGGMGSVFLGRDRTLDRPVAIKVIAPELAAAATIRERFLHEARTVARLRHPNVVAVYAAGEADGMLYFVMELVPGESLRDRLARDGRFDDRRAVEALRDLARALGAAHAQGVVHRDVKPENVLLDRDSGRAMLTDFGVARAFSGGDGRLTGTGFVLGSPKYMSPEQAAGERELDGRSDVYSLGLVAYEMFAGEPAVNATSAASMLVKQLTEKPAPIETRNDHIPPAVAAVISRALEKEPDARFPTADAMADALDGALDGALRGSLDRAPDGASPLARPVAAPAPAVGRRRGLLALVAISALVVALLGGWLALGRRGGVPRGVDPRKSYLVLPFEVLSGEQHLTWLREGSASMLTLSLAQWRDLDVVDYERGLDLLRDLRLDAARRIGLEDARRLARRAGVWTVVMGQVGGTADSLIVTASLYAVESGKRLEDAHRAAPRDADPRAVFDALARDLLNLAGAPSSVSVSKIAETTTSSVEAYRDYLEGSRALNAWDLAGADSLLAAATAKDSTFALAYYRRAVALGWKSAGDTVQATLIARARQYERRLPERERALLAAYADLTAGLRPGIDSAAADAAFQGAQQKYAAIIARDSGFAEAWYGLGDAYYHHRPGGFTSPRALANWNRALRAFDHTLALDSTFHLAYSHKLDTYQQTAQPNTWLVLDGDSVRAFRDSTEWRAFGDARYAEAKRRAQTLAVREARSWASADPAPTTYLALGRAYIPTRQFDSAAAVLREGMDRLGARSGTVPFARALALTRVDPLAAAEAIRGAARGATSRAIAAQGGSERFGMLVSAAGVAGLAGNAGLVDTTMALALAVFPANAQIPVNPKVVVDWLGASVKVAMGLPLGPQRSALDAGIDFMDKSDAPGMRAQNWQAPFVMFLATRDPRYAATVRRWRGDKAPPLDEMEALEALAAGDTARARAAVARFPSVDSIRAANLQVTPARWVARAEVFTELGDPRRAAAMYEILEPSRLPTDLMTTVEPGLALFARSYLARGRVYEQLGEREKAAAAYERFAALWKDADPALQPQVREARAGLARVRDAGKRQPVR